MTRKIALITGGSRGLGRSMAIHLADRNTDTIITYQSNEAAAKDTVAQIEKKGGKAFALKLDAGNTKSFEGFAAEVRKALKQNWQREDFDVLINNAGTGLHRPFAETTEEQFDQLMNVHFKGVYFLTQRLLPLIKDGGRILNISSGLARFSNPGASAYGAMKGAVETLTRYMAKELGPRKISVNVVAPGAIETDFNGGLFRSNEQMKTMITSMTALGRTGQADDIGSAVAALVSNNDFVWMNGQRIELSGGVFL